MNDNKTSKLIAISSVLTIALLLTIQIADARPTVAPPDGNPTLNVGGATGPAGPQGPTGATGSQGPAGFQNCTTVSSGFVNPNTYTLISCPSGYKVTGGSCEGLNYVSRWNLNKPYSNGWYCHSYESVNYMMVHAVCCQ